MSSFAEQLEDIVEHMSNSLSGTYGTTITTEMIANKFSRGDIYSTDEKMIGQWIDGKPLYQKTIDCGALPNAASKEVAHNISNISNIVSCVGQAFDSSGASIPLPFQNVDTASQGVSIYANITIVKLITGIDRSSLANSYVTLCYTKTTDSPISIGSDTDYSTTEKIVGTWLDGNPLWQKTFVISNPPDSTDISDLHIADAVNGVAVVKYPNNGETFLLNFIHPNYINQNGLAFTLQNNNTTLEFRSNGYTRADLVFICTLQYTKTS